MHYSSKSEGSLGRPAAGSDHRPSYHDTSVRPQTAVFLENIEDASRIRHHGMSVSIWEASEAGDGLRRHLEASGNHVGIIRSHLGIIWCLLASYLESSVSHLESSGNHLESSGSPLESSGSHQESSGVIWESSGIIWESSGVIWESSGVIWGSSGSHLRVIWSHLRVIWESSGRSELPRWSQGGLRRLRLKK